MKQPLVRRLIPVAFVAALFATSTSDALAQEGTVLQGQVLDGTTGEPLIGAQVVVVGTDQGTVTDVDGRYRLRLPAGSYSVKAVYLGFADKTVTGIRVREGVANFQDIALLPEAVEAEAIEVVISAEEERGSIVGALARQRNATNVVNGISAEEISQTPSSNAADAIKRVSSTSIVDDKYVYVRGLGERYSTAQLDGSVLPTPEPEKRVLPLDIFPASMVESLFTVKSYTADLPGDFAGGLVDIQTKDIPDVPFLSFSTGAGYNTNLSDLDRVDYIGGDLDWLGFDDGARELPDNFPDRIPATATDAERALLHSEFAGDFQAFEKSPDFGDVNKSFGLSFGAPVGWFGKDGGYLVGLSYSISADSREQEDFFPALEEGRIQYDYDTRLGSREVSIGAVGGYSVNVTPTSRLSLKTIFTQSADDEARWVTGPFDQSTSGIARITRFRFVERTLLNTKATYEHKAGLLGDSKVTWDGSYALALRDEPDTRQSSYVAQSENGTYFFNEGGNNSRFFSNLTDHMGQGGLKVESQFDLGDERATLDFGARGGYRSRDFAARRFSYEGASPAGRTLPPTELFTSERIAAGDVQFLDATEPNDEYDASELTAAGYASLGWGWSPSVRMTTGLRIEYNDTQIESFDPRTGSQVAPLSADLETVELLPTVTLQMDVADGQTLRFAGARTIVRPQFRELAPFRYDDYLQSTLGNPFLENGTIYNLDARWSWFPSLGEIVSVGGFYKLFNDPIEIVRLPTGGTNLGTPEPYNGPSAHTYGVELEVRNDIGRWSGLTGLGLASNVTLASSNVKQDESAEVFFGAAGSEAADLLDPEIFTNPERPMVNQSDFLVNASLYYTTPTGGTTVTLLYNGVGERLAQVGIFGFDDIYEQTRHVFDVTWEQRLAAWLDLKVSAENLTDAPYEFKIGDDIYQKYSTGQSFSAKLSYSF